MEKIEKLPNWILKILLLLTGNMSLSEFQEWLYQPDTEKFFPNNVYIELISFDYKTKLVFIDEFISQFISFEMKLELRRVCIFLSEPTILYLEEKDLGILPVSKGLLKFIYSELNRISYDIKYWEWEENNYKYGQELRKLFKLYATMIVSLLSEYGRNTDSYIIKTLATIYSYQK
ncbi:hypothetical protein NYR72_12185 [Actinobacillus equuli subsp. haemolyticus]|uniref:hypothetical protein n=1 Tax=Actinobacillus equuli TaxID=718 RepID=UPI002418B6CC|nr:hypothetical protein [Actinobacillus equuli]MDG4949222.1 hypothetical protein [Actinobacillus equuli subsp. haemolyticus]